MDRVIICNVVVGSADLQQVPSSKFIKLLQYIFNSICLKKQLLINIIGMN